MLIFKIFGFFMIISTTYLFGFFKANGLKNRQKKLQNIQKGIISLKEKIRANAGEIPELLTSSFGIFPIDYAHLLKGDVEILEEFFKGVGMGDTKAEYERCELYITLLNPKIEEAKTEVLELGKLYKNIGLFVGIFICIILL